MNQSQIKYAKERLYDAYHKRSRSIGSVYDAGYSYEEKKKLYKEGDYGVEYRNGAFVVVFPGEAEKIEEVKLKHKKLKEEYSSILDNLILGDAEEALNIIKSFAEGE